jgi:hypothetical protein
MSTNLILDIDVCGDVALAHRMIHVSAAWKWHFIGSVALRFMVVRRPELCLRCANMASLAQN